MPAGLSAETLLDDLRPWLGAPRWWIGLSGGLDSTCLLHLVSRIEDAPPLTAVHIDHQLHPDSGRWAEHCAQLSAHLGIEIVTRRVDVKSAGTGPEAAARAARYAVFEELVGEAELLLLAHHADDQVETFFLRLLRGAGIRGLTGMPPTRPLGSGSLLRPLLQLPRAELEAYARDQQLDWIEDSSNRDPSLDRNYLRHEVLPRLEQRWPAYRRSVEQAMGALADLEIELELEHRPLLEAARGEYFGESVLDLEVLQSAGAGTLAWLLRAWLQDHGLQPPGRARLEEFIRQLQDGSAQASPCLDLDEFRLERYQQRIHLRRPAVRPDGEWVLEPGVSLDLAGLGTLSLEAVDGASLRLPEAGHWQVRFRSGGERCQPQGRAHSQSLKKLLQDRGVPPWRRDCLPLLFADGELAAVADLWICEGQQAADGEQGFQLHWSHKPGPLD